jgi:hypothetical protein
MKSFVLVGFGALLDDDVLDDGELVDGELVDDVLVDGVLLVAGALGVTAGAASSDI